jgi:hypothetical protein
MPPLVIHLAVAMRICRLEGCAPSPDFLLGTIAPDAIHMRAGSEPGDKQRTHLTDIPDPQHNRLRELLASARSKGLSTMSFTKGYVAHILSDQLWGEIIGTLFRNKVSPDIVPQERAALYDRETDQIDLELYRQASWRAEVWSKLAQAKPVDFDAWLSAEEIARWRDRALTWFGDPAHDPKLEPVHITGKDVNEFVALAAVKILATFRAWES